jgi:hypothetical protein
MGITRMTSSMSGWSSVGVNRVLGAGVRVIVLQRRVAGGMSGVSG